MKTWVSDRDLYEAEVALSKEINLNFDIDRCEALVADADRSKHAMQINQDALDEALQSYSNLKGGQHV